MSSQNRVQDLIENIHGCNNAINIISELLYEFHVDSDTNKIPSYIKSERIKGGLLLAIQTAARSSQEALNWLETELEKGVENDS
jgi:hypothetical protein